MHVVVAAENWKHPAPARGARLEDVFNYRALHDELWRDELWRERGTASPPGRAACFRSAWRADDCNDAAASPARHGELGDGEGPDRGVQVSGSAAVVQRSCSGRAAVVHRSAKAWHLSRGLDPLKASLWRPEVCSTEGGGKRECSVLCADLL